MATAHILNDLVTHGALNGNTISAYLDQLSDRHAHSAQVAILKAATAVLNYTLTIRPRQTNPLTLDTQLMIDSVMSLSEHINSTTATVSFLVYAQPFPLASQHLSLASDMARLARDMPPHPDHALLAFSNAYSHVMTQVDGFAARYPHNKVFLSLQQDLARGALHLQHLRNISQPHEPHYDDALQPYCQAVQDYPLSVENQFALIRAALQVFQKNRITATLTSYVFLIENTLKVAQATLSDIAKRYPHLTPDLIATLHRNIAALACPAGETETHRRIQETATKIDQLADYFDKFET